MEKIAEGKTKIIFDAGNNVNGQVVVSFKDDITAGDGARRNLIENKGIYSNQTACNCFQLLNKRDVPTHFIKQKDERSFLAWRVNMIPWEVVVRRRAFGSYLKRNPRNVSGEKFPYPVVEFYLKDDSLHDPFLTFDDGCRRWNLYDAKKPLSDGFIKSLPPDYFRLDSPFYPRSGIILGKKDISLLSNLALATFFNLEAAWGKLNVSLVDLKIEGGYVWDSVCLVLADEITNDSWRIWPGDKSELMLDKQVYRDIAVVGAEDLKKVKKNYKLVADMTGKF